MAGSKRVVALVARPKAAAVRSSARVQAVRMAVAGLVIRSVAMALRSVESLMPVSLAVAAMGWPSSSRRQHCADVSTLSMAAPRTARGW